MARAQLNLASEETLDRVIQLRDRAITLIRENGQWQRFGATPVMTVRNHGNLTVVYLTPFQRATGTKGSEPLGYAIEVSAGRRIVLSVVWQMGGPLICETYRPGTWEALLVAPAVTASLAA